MYTKVLKYIDSGKKEGAKVEVGGSCIGSSGFFIQPTVFSDVTDDMTISREEVRKVWTKFSYSIYKMGFSTDFRSGAIDFEIQNTGRSY